MFFSSSGSNLSRAFYCHHFSRLSLKSLSVSQKSLFINSSSNRRSLKDFVLFLGKTYMYTGKLDKSEAMQYKCSNPCLYTMEGDDDKKFCFKPGQQESKCAVGSTGMPNFSRTSPGPGGMSSSPGGSRPPMTTGGSGGSGGMTTGGSGGSGGLYALPRVSCDALKV